MLRNIENQTSPLAAGNKRGAEVLLEQYNGSPLISPSTETVTSDNQSDTENYALKRPRTNIMGYNTDVLLEKIPPSRVLHVRNLPPDTSESEIMGLANKFGQVTNMILMRNKRQAFVEMGDIRQSMELLKHHQHPLQPAMIRDIPVQLQYSAAYTELKPGQRSHANGMKSTPVLHVNIDNLTVPVTLGVLHQIFSRCGVVEKIITFSKNNQFQSLIQFSDVNSAQVAKQSLDGKNVYPNCCVLRIDFSKMLSVNVRYNNEKSRDFTNPDLPSSDESLPHLPRTLGAASSLPHMINSGTQQAQRAMSMVPYGAAGALNQPQMFNPLSAAGLSGIRMLGAPGSTMMPAGYGMPPTSTASPAGLPPGLLTTQIPTQIRPVAQQHARLPDPTQQLNTSPQMKSTLQQQLQLQQFLLSQLQGAPVTPTANQLTMMGQPIPTLQPQSHISNTVTSMPQPQLTTSPPQQLTAQHQQHQQQLIAAQLQAQQAAMAQLQQYMPQYQTAGNPIIAQSLPTTRSPPVSTSPANSTPSPAPLNSTGPVVLVSNLNSKKVSPDALFTLFGMYGDVMRVKLLYNKLDTALVQFADHHMALTACRFLDKSVFWGNEINVVLSKHTYIQLPHYDPQGSNKLTKDYTNSALHRYQRTGSKNLSNIYPPSNTLHLSNIPSDISEDSPVFTQFSNYGMVKGFKFFDKDRRMALIQMSSVAEAIEALIGMHNYEINATTHLRVSFSKSTIHHL